MIARIKRIALALWCAAPSRWLRKGWAQMKTPAAIKATTSVPHTRWFTGTDNPLHLPTIDTARRFLEQIGERL
ncbi:MAG: hypothetical protein QUV35_01250 [Hydrogenophaga sp.]|uniref:hypothetical protein n=1 Tax=Hydrogenophaga sp. TaxID=1904254 RepID=UPI00261D7A8E|nr:hypothetical protein [Hydrogenophaga sp.]MDM7941231.1 hypothetical protein [Hydrogenophaga sp.]